MLRFQFLKLWTDCFQYVVFISVVFGGFAFKKNSHKLSYSRQTWTFTRPTGKILASPISMFNIFFLSSNYCTFVASLFGVNSLFCLCFLKKYCLLKFGPEIFIQLVVSLFLKNVWEANGDFTTYSVLSPLYTFKILRSGYHLGRQMLRLDKYSKYLHTISGLSFSFLF